MSKYIGKTTGMRVMAFQDKTLKTNNETKFTDEQLQKMWRDEFPDAVAFTLDHVSGVRSLYNRGIHTPNQTAPLTPISKWIKDANGNLVAAKEGKKGKTVKAWTKSAKSTQNLADKAGMSGVASAVQSLTGAVKGVDKVKLPTKSHTTVSANLELPKGTKVPMSSKGVKSLIVKSKKAMKASKAVSASA